MATKRKITKRSKRTSREKATPPRTQVKKARTPKRSAKRKAAQNKSVAKRKDLGKKAISGKGAGKKETREKSQGRNALAFSRETAGTRSGQQSGDLQGLSDVESVDSESVDELIEEGNAFEAEAMTGVENAGEHSEREVRTHEVPEDDVPGEYLDQD